MLNLYSLWRNTFCKDLYHAMKHNMSFSPKSSFLKHNIPRQLVSQSSHVLVTQVFITACRNVFHASAHHTLHCQPQPAQVYGVPDGVALHQHTIHCLLVKDSTTYQLCVCVCVCVCVYICEVRRVCVCVWEKVCLHIYLQLFLVFLQNWVMVLFYLCTHAHTHTHTHCVV